MNSVTFSLVLSYSQRGWEGHGRGGPMLEEPCTLPGVLGPRV